MSCDVMKLILTAIKGRYLYAQTNEMYPELLKRLDDSNDGVRLAVCGSMEAFWEAPADEQGAPSISKTILGYMVDALLIHLDDGEEEIQKAVMAVLKGAGRREPSLVGSKVAAVRSQHRTPEYCDAIMTFLDQIAKE